MKIIKYATLSTSKIKVLLFLVGLLILSSCLSPPRSKRFSDASAQTDTSNDDSQVETPEFAKTYNYFTEGSITSTNSLSLQVIYNNTFYLRGEEINNYIQNKAVLKAQCLILSYQKSTTHKYLALALTPKYFYDFTKGSKEYYYLVAPNNLSTNSTHCNKTEITNQYLASGTMSFSFLDLCPTCSFTQLFSDQTIIHQTTGDKLNSISVSHLTINIKNDSTKTPYSAIECSDQNSCKNIGFDCCLSGSCVNDKSLKSTTDTTSDGYLQALLDIEKKSSHITTYTNYFNICTENIITPPEPKPIDPSLEAYLNLLEKKELYECTHMIEGEMSLCTETFFNVTLGQYATGISDRNFKTNYTGNLPPISHGITKIDLSGNVLFENKVFNVNDVTIGSNGNGVGNDNLTDATIVNLNNIPSEVKDDNYFKIQYKIDGSCSLVSTNKALCEKHYVQGQNLGRVDDHYQASNKFLLPYYADLNGSFQVEVNGDRKYQTSHWNLVPGTPSSIQFVAPSGTVFDGQLVKIQFFVNLTVYPVFDSKNKAQQRINQLCQCNNSDCGLEKLLDPHSSVEAVLDYTCSYPSPTQTPPPLQQVLVVSAKSVPVRFFDEVGVSHKTIDIQTPKQEGTHFEYTNGDLLKPNNIDQYIGFSEIYGTLVLDANSAKQAKEISVSTGKTYDIFVDSGVFSSCYYCGTDYYTQLVKLFPNSLLQKGGGYTPDKKATNRFDTRTYRSDDFLYGRACFVPVTMMPWSHRPHSNTQTQRLRRQNAQHFLYANGYNRDWYGFDYGSVIGSFDGVIWFSIGNQRRIKAKSNKLFIAINGYFGDLTSENSYSVTVSDATNLPAAGATVTNDFDSDGAQCQKQHVCESDADCAATLGWDYTCQRVSNIVSYYPGFDGNAVELPDHEVLTRIFSASGTSSGSPRRCVYRGKGAPCLKDYSEDSSYKTFTQTIEPGLHSCSASNYCQEFIAGASVAKFNHAIARYGKSIKTQNADPSVLESDADTFGLAARLIGRPLSYIGTEVVSSNNISNLSHNKVKAICLPGKNPDNDFILNQHTKVPTLIDLGAKTLGIGITPTTTQASNYLSSCSIFGSDGNYFVNNSTNFNKQLDDAELVRHASSQAIPTNALSKLQSLSSNDLLKNFSAQQITSPYFEENRCLRAPGSPCFSDLDCAPSKFISSSLNNINAEDTNNHNILNMYEILFWQENLVCSQAIDKDDDNYNVAYNKCCRELGKNLTIGSLEVQTGFAASLSSKEAPVFNNNAVPGVNISIDSNQRLTQNSVIADLDNNPTTYPGLSVARADICTQGSGCIQSTTLNFQYQSFDEIAARTCCSSNWIREFHPDNNGGGHTWGPGKAQNSEAENFQCLNWVPHPDGNALTCAGLEDFDDPTCHARQMTQTEANQVENWLKRFELLGIGQIPIQSADFAELDCHIDITDTTQSGAGTIIPGHIAAAAETEYIAAGGKMFAASDQSNFDGKLKKIFSKDKVTCCQVTGTKMETGSDPNLCCSGYISALSGKCALPDYSNVSVYYNRYVSSEARDLSSTYFDFETGYIKSSNVLEQMACLKAACESGLLARGVSYGNFKVKGQENDEKTIKRFIDNDEDSSNYNGKLDIFKAGIRWSNDVYCAPPGINAANSDLVIIDCKDF